MACYVRYRDREDQVVKHLQFTVRASAEEKADQLYKEGHSEIVVIPAGLFHYEGNRIGLMLTIFGALLILIGFFLSFHERDVNFYPFLLGLIIGMFFIGMAEIIQQFDRLNRRQGK